jgi:UDP-N-acetylmuramoyl-L-alanyl-D-glutamate--2,6-diaminopimelate ligase
VWVTSDNPRSEPPEAIIDEIGAGIDASARRPDRYAAITDRKAAIRAALESARAGDVVVIAGKGHETTQDAGGRVTHFDDREVAREELEAMAWT